MQELDQNQPGTRSAATGGTLAAEEGYAGRYCSDCDCGSHRHR